MADEIPDDWSLVCAGLSVRRGHRTVLDNIGLTLRPGQCVSLVGPNGSGKTTLMLALLGLLPPHAGAVQLDGRDIRRYSARARGRFASYVPQIVDSVPAFSVYEVVAGGRYPHVAALASLCASDRRAVDAALSQCGLNELADRSILAVSGGERQKTLIAAAMAQDPQLMFLDEPSTALDPAYQLELVGILKRWCATGRGLLLISHDLQLPAALGGRVIALREGQVVADGSAADVLSVDTLSEVYGARFGVAVTPEGQQIVLPQWWHVR